MFARVTGTVAGFDRVFHARVKAAFVNYPNLMAYELPGHQTLRLPRQLQPLVDEGRRLLRSLRVSAAAGEPGEAGEAAEDQPGQA